MSETHAVTRLLDAVRLGEPGAQQRLLEAVYSELHGMAEAHMARETPGRTLQPTALINEAYLRLFANGNAPFENRRHFFAAAALAMHRIRVDDARSRRRLKRGGGAAEVGQDRTESGIDEPAVVAPDPVDLIELDVALTQLAQERPELVELVRLRFFVGLSLDETADVLGISRRTVAYRWRLARAWLLGAMGGSDGDGKQSEPDDGDGSLGSD